MQLIPLTEEGKAMLAEAAAAERLRHLKYERARRTLRVLGVFVTDLRAATIYPKLEAKGYQWDAEKEAWVKQQKQTAAAR